MPLLFLELPLFPKQNISVWLFKTSLFLCNSFNFDGTFHTLGRGNSDSDSNKILGAAGTVFIRDQLSSLPRSKIIIDGRQESDLPKQARTVLSLDGTESNAQFEYDKLVLKGNSDGTCNIFIE